MQIDAHVHYSKDPAHLDGLLRASDKIGTDKIVIFSTQGNAGADHDGVRQAYRAHPDRLIPFARLVPDMHTPADVRGFKEQGFVGFKCIKVRRNYDDHAYYPLYAAAAECGMPILFHLGIVARSDRDFDISSDRMRPIYLDTLARAFPTLRILGAHLGNPWYEEAAMAARWNSNLWFDLSGSTLKAKSPEFIRSLLWWDKPGHPYKGHGGKLPWDKIVFGTDVGNDWIEDVYRDYVRLCDTLEIGAADRQKIFGGNAAELLGLKA
jgi:uncharacterized protein